MRLWINSLKIYDMVLAQILWESSSPGEIVWLYELDITSPSLYFAGSVFLFWFILFCFQRQMLLLFDYFLIATVIFILCTSFISRPRFLFKRKTCQWETLKKACKNIVKPFRQIHILTANQYSTTGFEYQLVSVYPRRRPTQNFPKSDLLDDTAMI